MRLFMIITCIVFPLRAVACGLALVLAVDVSGSVDEEEYGIQMEGLAAALRDGIIVDALIDQEAQVSVVQWSGSSRQEQTIPWTSIASVNDINGLADRIAADPRKWRNYSTAIGEALALSVKSFEQVAWCKRKVIDVSGDGLSNEGQPPEQMRIILRDAGIVVNALAIETDDADLTAYFYENLIHGEGAFVITANGFSDYPEQIRRKLQRETTKQLSRLDVAP